MTQNNPNPTFWQAMAEYFWNKALAWAETHCWSCDKEIGPDWKDGDKCPHCNVDLVPF
jgi:hypothetical protein